MQNLVVNLILGFLFVKKKRFYWGHLFLLIFNFFPFIFASPLVLDFPFLLKRFAMLYAGKN